MIRLVLILSQLLVLPIPAGLCTCARAKETKASACPCCQGECCCRGSCSKPTAPARRPCSEPSCPANHTIVRAEPALPTVPLTIPAPDSLTTEPGVLAPRFAAVLTDHAITTAPDHLFLVFGALLI